jgi:hypothetical protein
VTFCLTPGCAARAATIACCASAWAKEGSV